MSMYVFFFRYFCFIDYCKVSSLGPWLSRRPLLFICFIGNRMYLFISNSKSVPSPEGGFFNLHPDWGLYFLLTETCWHFGNSHEDDGSALAPVVRTLLSLCRDPVQFLVGELRPLKPSRQGPQKMTNNLNPMATNHTNFATVCDDVGTQGMKRLKRKLAEIQQKALNMYCQRWFHLFLRMPLSS